MMNDKRNRRHRVARCMVCGLHPHLCVCGQLPALRLPWELILVQHAVECSRPTNTGRLACALFPNSRLLLYANRSEPVDEAALTDPGVSYHLMMPRPDARDVREVAEEMRGEGPVFRVQPGRRLFQMPDGTKHEPRQSSSCSYSYSNESRTRTTDEDERTIGLGFSVQGSGRTADGPNGNSPAPSRIPAPPSTIQHPISNIQHPPSSTHDPLAPPIPNPPSAIRNPRPLRHAFVILDGSWAQASHMARRIRPLRDMPCVKLPDGPPGLWMIRRPRLKEQYCTAEAAIRLAAAMGHEAAAAEMLRMLDWIQARMLHMRGWFPRPLDLAEIDGPVWAAWRPWVDQRLQGVDLPFPGAPPGALPS